MNIFAKLYGISREQRKRIVPQLLEEVDLTQWAQKPVKLFSGGMRRRLEIARGLVQAGARVIVSSRKVEDVEASAKELAQLGDCVAIPADISTPEGAAELTAATRARFASSWTT